eukprot:5264210-Amphidinium_carterae.1
MKNHCQTGPRVWRHNTRTARCRYDVASRPPAPRHLCPRPHQRYQSQLLKQQNHCLSSEPCGPLGPHATKAR